MSKNTLFLDHLLTWHSKNARDLPWKNNTNAYDIWVSEIILQQTTVRQGLNYFNRFLARFPTIFVLAQASEKEVLKAWEGLGYYSRARNMHATAKFIVAKYNGLFPESYDELLALKGIGPYTAAAISSFAYDLPYAAVDGNVLRVFTRYHGIKKAIDKSSTVKLVRDFAQKLIIKTKPSVFNQALMDFGSLQCVPRHPDCHSCIMKKDCVAFKNNFVSQVPFKSKKIVKKSRYFHYLHLSYDGSFAIKQRKEKDIWKGLYDFPLVETNAPDEVKIQHFTDLLSPDEHKLKTSPRHYKQSLTHQTIHAFFYRLQVNKKIEFVNGCEWVSPSEMKHLAFPKVVDLYLSDKSITLF